ncbi:MAG: hypothetical protein H6983_08905 [Ectothiorhodospiraceae bacterium]|nr:hypothetical protein [Planctomycetota bacterium]MCP5152421.1 hypothetical protein [Chromatiales bacterium]MCP5154269.1 hypothetical protein [Ectothiorhodospiraceae bacterium]
MSRPDPAGLADLVASTLGRRPSAESAERMAAAVEGVGEALAALAAESLFDTEPQNLETVLAELAPPAEGSR